MKHLTQLFCGCVTFLNHLSIKSMKFRDPYSLK